MLAKDTTGGAHKPPGPEYKVKQTYTKKRQSQLNYIYAFHVFDTYSHKYIKQLCSLIIKKYHFGKIFPYKIIASILNGSRADQLTAL